VALGSGLSLAAAAKATGRSEVAVEAVRDAICLYHRGDRATKLLTESQKEFLDANQGRLTCWKCNGTI
jgi:hypothetical protein